MKNLELSIPPDFVLLGVALLMWVATLIVPSFALSLALRLALGLLLVIAGLGIVQIAGISFRQARTTVDPTRPGSSSALIVSGIYRYSRNPIYLGMTVVLLGWGAFLQNLLSLALITLFVLYINRFQILPEERALSGLFGAQYESYRARVRRWL